MDKLKLYKFPTTSEERIQSQIDRFAKELKSGDANLDAVNDILGIVLEYLCEFDDDPFLSQAFIKLNEGSFWLDSWIRE
jgi:hypothetical protein